VDLTPRLVEVLADRMSLQDTEAAVGGQRVSPWLFPGLTGEPWDDR
jgi:hypothetical protein